MGLWKHITIGERESFMVLLGQGKGVRQIAEATGRSPSTVSRELKRNSGEGPYSASEAQRRADERRGACGRKKRLADPGPRALVQEKILVERRSPEQVPGRLRLEAGVVLGAAAIYRAIAAREPDAPELRRTARAPREGCAARARGGGRGANLRSAARSRSPGTTGSAPRRRKAAPGWATGRPAPCWGALAGRASSPWRAAGTDISSEASSSRGRRCPWPGRRSAPSPGSRSRR